MIVSLTETWATSKSKRKSYLCSIIAADLAPKRVKQIDWAVSFDNANSQLISDHGNNPIIISATISNYHVHQILINNGSAMEVL